MGLSELFQKPSVMFAAGVVVALIVVLLAYVFMRDKGEEEEAVEHYYGYAPAANPLGLINSGATQRHGVEFSGTNQENPTYTSNADLGQKGLSGTGRVNFNMQENLVNGRGEPDFWTITEDLGRAQSQQEHMVGDKDEPLRDLLY